MTEYFERDGKRWLRTEISLSDIGLPFPIPPITVEPPPTAKLLTPHSVVNGAVKLTGVDSANMVLWDNEFSNDTPEDELLMLMADKGKVNLAGFVITNNPDPNFTLARIEKYFTDNRDYLVRGGMKNIPVPVLGSSNKLVPTGNIDTTIPSPGLGVDLIISSAHKCSAEKPLLIFVGGQCTSVASAYLKDKTIAPKVIVFHTDGWFNDQKSSYNLADKWSAEIVMKRMKYVVVNSNQNPDFTYWWTGKNMGLTQAMIDSLPAHPAVTLLKNWYRDAFAREGMADASPVLWWLDNTLWKSVQRRKQDGSSTPNEDYDYLFITGNDWPKYGAVLIDKFKELLGVVIPPIVTPPIGAISSGFQEAIQTAAPDKQIRIAPGLKFTLKPIDVQRNVSIDFGGSTVTAVDHGTESAGVRRGILNINGGKISNVIFNGANIGYAAIQGQGDVKLDVVKTNDFNFTGAWLKDGRNVEVTNCEFNNSGWADTRYMTGGLMINNLTDYLINGNKFFSNKNSKGTGIESNSLIKESKLTNGEISDNEFRLSHHNPWAGGSSQNFAIEFHDMFLNGVEIKNNYFGNEISLACHRVGNGAKNKVYNNRGDLGGDYFFIEAILNDLEVYDNVIHNVKMFSVNYQRNGVWRNHVYRNNTVINPSDPPSWGKCWFMIGGDGVQNYRIENNNLPMVQGRVLVQYQGTRGGVTEV